MSINIDKEEFRKIINDTIKEQMAPLREEIDTLASRINNDIKINYLSTMARALEREANQLIQTFECSYDVQTGQSCKSDIKTKIANYTQSLAVGDVANSLTQITRLHNEAKKKAFDSSRTANCNRDWKQVSQIVSRHKEIVKDLSTSLSTNNAPSDLGELEFEPQNIFDEIIFPFSHILRIQIIHTLKNGPKRFTALKNELEVKNTGLLVHHLKPLTEAKLIIQDHRKQYTLSEKGYMVVRYLSQLADALSPKEPIVSMVQPLVVLQD
ncbi:MAG: hypothetical protein INQ03_16615 [Candidatus Heimdallarchaeota archaeon]|nr:hypothetical protein [Candidatus Heimdallarchaeota archaeon]